MVEDTTEADLIWATNETQFQYLTESEFFTEVILDLRLSAKLYSPKISISEHSL